MNEYTVVTAAGDKYIIKVDKYTINELKRKGAIVKYEVNK